MAGAWIRVALAAGRADGVDTAAWTAAAVAGGDPAALEDPGARVSWPVVDRFLAAIGEDYRSPLERFHLGRLMNGPPAAWPRFGAFVSPGRLLEWSVRRLADGLVRPMEAEVRRRGGRVGEARVALLLGERCESGETLLWMTAGQCAMVPAALGQPEALVDADVSSRAGVFDLRLPPSRTLASRLARTLRMLARARRAADELGLREFEVMRARAELASLREEFGRLLDQAPHGVLVHDRGEILHANPAFAELLGLPARRAGELAGARVESRLAFDDAGDWRRFLDPGQPGSAPEGGRGLSLRARVCRPGTSAGSGPGEGDVVHLQMVGSRPVRFGGRVARLVALQDVTRWRAMEREVVRAGDLERRRIALDLHDVLGQTLAALSLHAQTLERRTRSEPAALREPAATLAPLVRDALQITRALARGLDPVGDWEGGLPRALRRLAQCTETTFGLAVAVEAPDAVPSVPDEVNLQLYRVAQEALGNVARHAGASRARVRLEVGEAETVDGLRAPRRRVELTIEDDGCGMGMGVGLRDGRDGTRARDGDGGFGLLTMQFRCRAIGGRLAVGPGPGGTGTRVTASACIAVPSARGGRTEAGPDSSVGREVPS